MEKRLAKIVYGKKDRTIRRICIAVCYVFTAVTFLILLHNREYSHLSICAQTAVLIVLPVIAEHLLSCRLGTGFYLFAQIYSILPMIGEAYKMYYITHWWDKMLHFFGGFTFAVFGFFLFGLMTEDYQARKKLAGLVFAFCFSMTISTCWEFVEFGADRVLGMDMQNDTVVHSITSYYLDDTPGTTGTIEGITQVIVNGKELPVDGYLDLGLIDTMNDLFACTAGAMVFAVYCAAAGSASHIMVHVGHVPAESPGKEPDKDNEEHGGKNGNAPVQRP